MKYNFDEIIDRKKTSCVKWDFTREFLGSADLLPMWVADMDFRTPDFIVEAVKRRAEHEIFGYTVRPESYYQSIIQWIWKRHQWKIEKDWILFSPGIVPALNLAVMAFSKPGDKVIVQPPVYFPFFSAVTQNDRQLVYNQLILKNGRYCMDFDDLLQKTDDLTSMIIITNPQNPGGTAWTEDELIRLGNFCCQHNITLVSDEIHSDLVFAPFKHTVVAGLSEKIASNTITMMAPSKTFNLAGLSTSSVIISDPALRKSFNNIIERVHIGMGNIFGMVASEAAYTCGEEWLGQLLSYVKGNIDFMEDYIRLKIPGLKMIRPEATYMVWLDFRDMKLSNEKLKELIVRKAGLGLNDGSTFGPGGEGFQRINVACPRILVVEAMNRLEKAVNGRL
jgi:cystathionine beta-lyase